MPRLAIDSVPAYRLHRQSGQAIVTLSGRDFLLGTHGTDASRRRYQRLIAEWLTNGRQLPPVLRRQDERLTVNELILRYWRFAKTYYKKNGHFTSEVDAIKSALTPLKELYGTLAAADFGPLSLQVVRDKMVNNGWTRRTVNHQTARVKRAFKWAVAQEIIPASCHHGLCAVEGLRRGRSAAREAAPVKAVGREHVLGVVRKLSPSLASLLEFQDPTAAEGTAGSDAGDAAGVARRLARNVPDESPVAAMIAVQWLTGMRPAEIVELRGADIEMTASAWTYRPGTHKTEHFGLERVVALGLTFPIPGWRV